MKNYIYIKITWASIIGMVLVIFSSCERDPSEDVAFATFSNNPNVFIDTFSGGLDYNPFLGSDFGAFNVDDEIVFSGEASMRFDIPNVGNPEGSFAGGIFPDRGARDLSSYDALTFYARASQAATIDAIGFGDSFGENRFLVAKENLRVSTSWEKYIIPIPDASKLKREEGMFWYSEGPENNNGYTFWIDELKYERLGNIAQPRPAMFNGEDRTERGFIDSDIQLTGLTQTFNLGSGINETVNAAPSYFNFSSSNIEVARVSELGVVSVIGMGSATITAQLNGVRAAGSLTIDVSDAFESAPTPTQAAADVISIFSDAYTNVPVDFFNGFFGDVQTTLGGATTIGNENLLQYTELNFVAIEFKNPTINVSEMTHVHVDIQIQEDIDPSDFITIELGDFGPDNVFGGGNDTSSRVRFDSAALTSNEWISLDIPLSDFTSLPSRMNLAQFFFISDGTISNILADNVYFYKE